MSVKLTGWTNGGIQQKMLSNVKPVSSLGSKKDLQNTVDTAKGLGVDIYLDGVTQYAYDSSLLDGFFVFTDAARFISKEKAELFEYNPISYGKREMLDSYYLLHPDIAEEMTANLAAAAAKYGTGISFRETGKDLSADYYESDIRHRQEVLNQQAGQIRDLVDQGQKAHDQYGQRLRGPVLRYDYQHGVTGQ